MNVKEMVEQRAEVEQRIKRLHEKVNDDSQDWTDRDQAEFDRSVGQHKALTARIGMEGGESEEFPVADYFANRKPLNQPTANAAADDDGERLGHGWRDTKSGREVRTFGHRDGSVAEHLLKTGAVDDEFAALTPGAYLRAMVSGSKTPLEQRALAGGTDSAGGFTVPDILAARFIDLLRSRTVTLAAGARTVPVTSDNLSIAKWASDPEFTWRAENAAVNESDPTLTRILFEPKTLAVIVRASRELIDDSVNIERMLQNSFARATGLAVDQAGLIGSGSGSEPEGIVNTTGIQTVTGVGALDDYDPLVEAAEAILAADAPMPTAAVMAPRTWAELAVLKATDNQPLLRPPALDPVRMFQTTTMPVDEGTGDDESSIVMGEFQHLLYGVRTSMRVQVLRERFADNLQVGFLAWLRVDVAVEHAEAFARISGITPPGE